jgi:predicted O-methyltransferase YrrM
MAPADTTNTTIHHRKGKLQTTIVQKQGSEVRLLLMSPNSPEWQSRIDLANPSKLMCHYMEAMMLVLLWTREPLRMHVMGLGGGQLPMLLRSHFPDAAIDCTEIDPDVYELARKFFSFRPDPRLGVFVEDGRAFLESRPNPEAYDVIFLDAFVGVGAVPLRLSTQEFFRVCKKQLSAHGTLVVNVLPKGGLVLERLATLASVFRNVYTYERDQTLVLFANDDEGETDRDLVKVACELQERHNFSFPYPQLAARLARVKTPPAGPQAAQLAPLLTDETPPQIIQIPPELCRSTGRNDPCPCGSGRKFKKCHGVAG